MTRSGSESDSSYSRVFEVQSVTNLGDSDGAKWHLEKDRGVAGKVAERNWSIYCSTAHSGKPGQLWRHLTLTVGIQGRMLITWRLGRRKINAQVQQGASKESLQTGSREEEESKSWHWANSWEKKTANLEFQLSKILKATRCYCGAQSRTKEQNSRTAQAYTRLRDLHKYMLWNMVALSSQGTFGYDQSLQSSF